RTLKKTKLIDLLFYRATIRHRFRAVMAKRKKATGKTKAKRKKTRAKASTRKKKTTVRKTRPIAKKTTRKASLRGVSPRKAKPNPVKQTAVKPTPTPRQPQPVPAERRIGVVTHYYSHLSVATLRLEPGATLRIGDVIHILGHTTDFSQSVESLEVDRKSVLEVGSNDDFGLKVVDHAREHDVVFKVRS